jgi:membrane protease YdiL (CAAX protease family)
MAEIARLFRFDDQPPLIQLIFSFCIVVVAGTILFWLFIIAGSLFFGIAPGKMVQIPASDPDESGRLILKYIQFSQEIGLFLIPAVIIALLIRKSNESFLKLDRSPAAIKLLLVVFLAFLVIPVLNYTGILNSRMVLPDALSGIQQWMRTKEDLASRLTGLLITSSGALTLTLNIFILAIVPAFCEEFLFRGLLQQILNRLLRSSNAAIWVTAIIFSSIHFQFFGFLPRLILGLVFGYLFYWTGNLWYPIIAHFVNNLIPVMISYFSGWRSVNVQMSDNGKLIGGFPFVAIIFSGLILFYFWREFRRRSGVTAWDSSTGDKTAVT